jgi:hypothetical protein
MRSVQPNSETQAFTIVDGLNGSEPKPSAGITAARLRVDSNVETTTVKRLLTRVAVETRPNAQLYVRVHPDPAFRMEGLGLIEFERDRRIYAVDPPLCEMLKPHVKLHYVFTATTITRAIFLWVIKMPGEDGSWNAWPQSKYDCARAAEDRWLQVHSVVNFEPHILEEPRPDPDWGDWLHPCTKFDDLLDLAFKSTFINKIDHPVIEALLRGK